MAVVITKSGLITNFEAIPPKMNDTKIAGGRSRILKATVEVAAADDDTSKYLMFPVKSFWSIHSLLLLNDAITVGTSYDIGIFDIAGAAVLATAYASIVSMAAARVAPLDVAFEARDIASVLNEIWQDAGVSADPETDYYIGLLANTVGTGAGTITLIGHYTDGS